MHQLPSFAQEGLTGKSASPRPARFAQRSYFT